MVQTHFADFPLASDSEGDDETLTSGGVDCVMVN